MTTPAGHIVRSWRLRPMWLIMLAMHFLAVTATAADDPFPRVAASYLVQINGTTVRAHDARRRLPPASLTKIMTVLLVIEQGKLDEVATVGMSAAGETGNRIGLKQGDRMRVGDQAAATDKSPTGLDQ